MTLSKSERNKEMKELIDSGWRYREVAEYFGISKQRVHKILHKKEKKKVIIPTRRFI